MIILIYAYIQDAKCMQETCTRMYPQLRLFTDFLKM